VVAVILASAVLYPVGCCGMRRLSAIQFAVAILLDLRSHSAELVL
jgi:hypothetical protein